MSSNQIEQLQADADYYHDRVALLRAKLYRWGLGTNPQLQELERELELAQQRLREEHLNMMTGAEDDRQRNATSPPSLAAASGVDEFVVGGKRAVLRSRQLPGQRRSPVRPAD
ncbi:MAG: hypothetical protein ACTHMY_20405 [Solirubrobacteraceae bacterium]